MEKVPQSLLKNLQKKILNPQQGKNKWSKRSIETMLENEKYTGSVKLLDSVNKENYYLLKNNQEPIISEETFKKYKKKRKREVTL